MALMNDSVQVLLDRQRLLADFGDLALQCSCLDEVLTTACRLVAKVLGTSRAKVLELTDNGARMFLRAGIGWEGDVIGHLNLPMSDNSSESYSIRTKVPVVTRDIRQEDRFDFPDFMKREGVVAVANAPIFLPGGTVYGLLQVDATEPCDFTDDDSHFLRTYCSILGQVVDRLLKERALRSSEERFRMTLEAATDYAIFITDADGRITDWLPGAEAVFGWTAQEAKGLPSAIIFTPEDLAAGQPDREIETARRTGSASDVREHLCKDGRRVFIEGIMRALFDAQGRTVGFIKIGQDKTARRNAEERLRTLLEGIPQLVWRSVARGHWTWASPQWLTFTGQSQQEAQGHGWMDAVHPDDHETLHKAWNEAQEHHELDVEFRIRRAGDGAWLWHHTRSRPVHDSSGRIVEWLGTSTDVQSLKELQERQQILVAELQHRTRNLIGVIGSIASQTMASTGPTQAFLDQFKNRLSALSRVQGLLSRASHDPITLHSLLEMELHAMGAAPHDDGTLDGPIVRIRPTIVQTLALAFHELATNARKYGALSERAGKLTVRWRVAQAAGGPRILIEWRESGISPPAAPDSDTSCGYGRLLIEKALPYSLDAHTTYELGSDQLICTINLPLDRPSRNKGEVR